MISGRLIQPNLSITNGTFASLHQKQLKVSEQRLKHQCKIGPQPKTVTVIKLIQTR